MAERQGTNNIDDDIDSLRAELIAAAPDVEEGFAEPLHTQTPNDFFDYHLKRIDSFAELKVVCAMIRFTFGYHRSRFRMGIEELRAYTGLKSRKSVTEGTKAAEKHNLIRRANPGSHKRAEWELIVSRKFYATDAYNLRDSRVDSTLQVRKRKNVLVHCAMPLLFGGI